MSLSISANYTLAHRYVNTLSNRKLLGDYSLPYSPPMNIGEKLDKAMADAGFRSQSALSRASGVPQPTINRILKGIAISPETPTLRKLADACKVSVAWLMGEKAVSEYTPPLHRTEQVTSNYSEPILQFNTPREAELLTKYRLSTEAGKLLIEVAADTAPKDQQLAKKLKKI